MDGWMDGWMGGWMDGWMDGQTLQSTSDHKRGDPARPYLPTYQQVARGVAAGDEAGHLDAAVGAPHQLGDDRRVVGEHGGGEPGQGADDGQHGRVVSLLELARHQPDSMMQGWDGAAVG